MLCRKLTSDCRWPWTTPFAEVALCGWHPAPLLALRTLKADVITGLPEEVGELAAKADPDWLVRGGACRP